MLMNITESKRIGSFTRIRKYILFIIASVVLIGLSLPVSFSAVSISPTTSPMSIPESSYNSGVLKFAIVYYHTSEPHYRVNEITVNGGSNFRFSESTFLFSDSSYTFTESVYNLSDGSLYYENSGSAQYNSYQNRYQRYLQSSDANVTGLYFIVPDVVNVSYTAKVVEPFVTWSQQPLEHNIYHSQLSEPVADEYNSYFICNDRLYWLSYRANGLYSFTNNFELNSQLYSESASFESSGSGSFSGQSGGSTETVTAPYVIVSGSVSNGEVFNGSASSPNFGEIDYVGSSQGSLSVSSNGQMTYNGLNVYPVAINNQILNRLYDVIIYLTDSSGFKIWLCPRSDLGTSLVVDASLYCSVFELTNGEYVSSSFSSYTGSYDHAGFDFPLDDDIADVRCYGCAFYNVNNIPVGLSDVLWAYDLEFVQWRDSMLDKLNQIYGLLSNAFVPETTTYSFGEVFENMSNPDFSELSPHQMGVDLNNVWQDTGDSMVSGSSTVKGWMSAFSIPKIISLCVLALATGTVILTLGKNKQDSA